MSILARIETLQDYSNKLSSCLEKMRYELRNVPEKDVDKALHLEVSLNKRIIDLKDYVLADLKGDKMGGDGDGATGNA